MIEKNYITEKLIENIELNEDKYKLQLDNLLNLEQVKKYRDQEFLRFYHNYYAIHENYKNMKDYRNAKTLLREEQKKGHVLEALLNIYIQSFNPY